MQTEQKGFTLIELMIVVAIIAILAAIAIPQYQNYAIRAKVSEAVIAADAAKTAVSEGFQSGGMTGVSAVANNFTATSGNASKYVASVVVTATTGAITVTMAPATTKTAAGLPADVGGTTLVFTPNVKTSDGKMNSLSDGVTGNIDWACTSTTSTTATSQSFTGLTAGTLPAKYAPSSCQ